MRLVTVTSIATLAVAVAALVLVLMLFITEPWAEDESTHLNMENRLFCIEALAKSRAGFGFQFVGADGELYFPKNCWSYSFDKATFPLGGSP